MIYYVDSKNGNDKNDGMSRHRPFRSLQQINNLCLQGGDQVLFKAECQFHGQLTPKRCDDKGVITFGRYGVGAHPELIGTGTSCVFLQDFPYVEIQQLTVTNPKGACGIHVVTNKFGELKHIHIRGCHIHHVNTNFLETSRESGGIILKAFSPDEPSWFEDVIIEDNIIDHVARTGIMLTSLWACRPGRRWGKNNYVDDDMNWWPAKEVIVRGNQVNKVQGNGIFIIGTVDGVIEWNTVLHSSINPCEPADVSGIWAECSNNCLIQYNEVGYSQYDKRVRDALAFIVGYSCRDTIVQYNYSHDNDGGFILMFEAKDSDTAIKSFRGTIIRNNISVNDGGEKGEIITLSGLVKGVFIENNTYILSEGTKRLIEVFVDKENPQISEDITLRNNIFCSQGNEYKYNLNGGKNFRIEHNLYWGSTKAPLPNELGALTANPRFQKMTTGNGWDAVLGYTPESYSPALFYGTDRTCDTGYDFFGNSTEGILYIGAIAGKQIER